MDLILQAYFAIENTYIVIEISSCLGVVKMFKVFVL